MALTVALALWPGPAPAQVGKPTSPQAIIGWFAKDDIGGRYRVEFPAKPEPFDGIWNSAAGGGLLAHHFMLQRGGQAFLSGYADYPSDGDAVQRLDKEVQLFAASGYTLAPVQRLTVSDRLARRFTGTAAGSGTLVEALFVIDGRRLYKVMVSAGAGQDNPADRQRFIDSFLLLAPPLPPAAPPATPPSDQTTAVATGGAWIADARTGCRVWNAEPEDGESIRWSGACADGLAQGPGVLEWFKDGKPTGRYEGEYRAGKMNGRGKYADDKGEVYEGEFRDNDRTGHGVLNYANGDRYEGSLINGGRSGQGVMVYANGARYEGPFLDNKRHGHGVMTFADGMRYEGDFRDNQMAGRGILSYKSGNRYEGSFADDKRHRKGTFTWANGNRFVGEFQSGKMSGHGIWTSPTGHRIEAEFHDNMTGTGVWTAPNGDRYQGTFVDAKFDGRGVYVYASGGRYEGQFRAGHIEGRGVMTLASGDRLEGEFHGDKPNGPGVLSRTDGTTYTGNWRNGCFSNGTVWFSVQSTPEVCGFK